MAEVDGEFTAFVNQRGAALLRVAYALRPAHEAAPRARRTGRVVNPPKQLVDLEVSVAPR